MQTERCCWHLEELDAIQRNLDKLQKWAHRKSHSIGFNKTKSKVLHLTWCNLQYQHRLGDEQPCPEQLRDAGGWKVGHDPAMSTCSPEQQPLGLGCIKRSSIEIPIRILHPALGPPTLRAWIYWIKSRGGPQRLLEGCSTSPLREPESWNCSPWRGEGSRVTLLLPSSSKRQPTRRLERSSHTGM